MANVEVFEELLEQIKEPASDSKKNTLLQDKEDHSGKIGEIIKANDMIMKKVEVK